MGGTAVWSSPARIRNFGFVARLAAKGTRLIGVSAVMPRASSAYPQPEISSQHGVLPFAVHARGSRRVALPDGQGALRN